MKYNKGFAPVLILIIALGVLAVGGVAYFAGKSSAPKNEVSDNSNYFPTVTSNTNDNVTPPVIAKPSITVISPNGGENWKIGQTYLISTKSNGELGTRTVRLNRYSDDGVRVGEETIGTINSNSFSYKVPVGTSETRGNAGRYKIQIIVDKYNSGLGIADESDNYFTITSTTQPTLTQAQAQALVIQTWGGCTSDTCGSVNVTVQNNNGQYTVTAIYEGLRDDSSSAQKKVAPAYYSNNAWTLGNATVTQRCQPGRGHQDFSAALCI